MTKIYFDFDEINSKILPNLNNTISSLEEVIRYQDNQTWCPDEYWYAYYYNDHYKNYIREALNEYREYRSLIETTNKKLNNVLSHLDDNLYSMKSIEIKNRNEIVY